MCLVQPGGTSEVLTLLAQAEVLGRPLKQNVCGPRHTR